MIVLNDPLDHINNLKYLSMTSQQLEVLPFLRTTLGRFLIDYKCYDDDVIQCYISGNNSQSYSGY